MADRSYPPSDESSSSIHHENVLTPPSEPPFSARRCLMRANNGALDHPVLFVRVIQQNGEDALPDACFRPSSEPFVDAFPIAVAFRQVFSMRPASENPQHTVDEPTVVRRRHTAILFLTRQHVPDILPLRLTQFVTCHRKPSAMKKPRGENTILLATVQLSISPSWVDGDCRAARVLDQGSAAGTVRATRCGIPGSRGWPVASYGDLHLTM